ncbi:MAG: endonuclease/exonuclease/phosphatase family protein [Candidatus Kapaibacteriota bacterium]|jgi:endonuclease/exonuclease/phosphatase family metal-dependent hydrolase
MKVHNFLIVFLIVLFFGCGRCTQDKSSTTTKPSNPNEIIVGTFNIEWLGDGIDDRNERSEQDYKNIAKIIEDSQCDLVGVQEIENLNAISKVIKYLPEYSFFISRDDAPQKVGIIFRKDIKVRYIQDYTPLEVEQSRTRPGIVVAVQKGNFDFLALVVHFKATSHFDNTPQKLQESRTLRTLQAEVVSRWIDSILSLQQESDLFVIGDFNDTPLRKKFNTLIPLLSNSNVIFLTEKLKSCKMPNAYVIDHILVTKSVLERYYSNSVNLVNTFELYSKEVAEKISDHCLVFARFDVTKPDNDPSKYFETVEKVAQRW